MKCVGLVEAHAHRLLPRVKARGWVVRAAGVLLLGGCAVGRAIEPPSITISSLRLEDRTLLEQRFLAALRIQNPNPVDLAIEGIAYDLEVNGQPFAKGVGKGPVVIPAFGQGIFETEAITTLMGFIRQFRELERARRALFAYRLTGKVKLRDHSFPLPFEVRGDNLWSTAPRTRPNEE
jgi:LEA14-like dessication related protein